MQVLKKAPEWELLGCVSAMLLNRLTTPPVCFVNHLPDNGVPSEPTRWGKITGEAL